MALVGDYTWEIGIDIQGGESRLKNTPDWTDVDWGDGNCDGIMEVTTGGGPNTPSGCAPSGEVKFRFNDQTLAYTILPAVEFETSLSGCICWAPSTISKAASTSSTWWQTTPGNCRKLNSKPAISLNCRGTNFM